MRSTGTHHPPPPRIWAGCDEWGGPGAHVWAGPVLCVWLGSIPGQGAARLVFDDTGFEEVAFLLQVDHFAHPREGVLFIVEELLPAELRGATVGDVAQIALEHGAV